MSPEIGGEGDDLGKQSVDLAGNNAGPAIQDGLLPPFRNRPGWPFGITAFFNCHEGKPETSQGKVGKRREASLQQGVVACIDDACDRDPMPAAAYKSDMAECIVRSQQSHMSDARHV